MWSLVHNLHKNNIPSNVIDWVPAIWLFQLNVSDIEEGKVTFWTGDVVQHYYLIAIISIKKREQLKFNLYSEC